MQALEEQASALATERTALGRLRTELEKASNRVEQERLAWEKSKVSWTIGGASKQTRFLVLVWIQTAEAASAQWMYIL